MNNAQIAQNIKDECKTKKVPVSKLLEDCVIRKGFIYDLEKRDYTPSVEIMGKIADYLDVSVDYLLGRTNNLKVQTNNNTAITGSNIVNGNVENSSNINTAILRNNTIDETAEQVLNAFQSMTLADKAKVITLIAELTEKNKTA
ncbi:MAG: helix-turn-helix domain-containing protein [Ruminococcus sp.]|nr:helix-turn-helix domain-containing protein [Ruminococcus sp.]